MKVYSEVFGCSSNLADYEIASGILEQAGFRLSDNPKKSDLNIIFTCSVKAPTEQKMIHRMRELTSLGKPLVVAGCMPKNQRKIIERINPNASLLGPDSIEKIAEVASSTINGKKIILTEDLRKPKVCLPKIRKNPVIDVIPISIGCLGGCSYCSVRFARGKLFSYPMDLILEEVRQALISGCKEVHITSQDNSCYGLDSGTNLAGLLNKICNIEEKFLVRVGMMNPLHVKRILDDLVAAYYNEKIFKFLHLPVQSCSSRILKLMDRGYDIKTFLEIVKRFYEAFPDLSLSTDVIVGFPTEEESDFEDTLKIIERVEPDVVNISRFGPRPGTRAAGMKQLPINIVNKRSKELFELVREVSFEKNQKWLNRKIECLIDEKGIKKGTWIGRNLSYKLVIVKSEKNLLGKFLSVEIFGAKSNYLTGKII